MRVIPYEQGLLDSEIEVEEANYLSLDNGSHKFYTRPLIDYDMALFLAPMEMAGEINITSTTRGFGKLRYSFYF